MRITMEGYDPDPVEKPDPNVKHESDLTSEERRELARKQWKSMTAQEKRQYSWDYYKWTIPAAALIIFLIFTFTEIYQRSKLVQLMSIAMMDVPVGAEKEKAQFSDDLLTFLGSGAQNETIDIDSSLQSGNSSSAVMKLTVIIAAHTTDLLVCNEETYQSLAAEEAFWDWNDILGEEKAAYSDYLSPEGWLDLSLCPRWNSYAMTYYSPVYAGLLISSDKTDMARGFARFVTMTEKEGEKVE